MFDRVVVRVRSGGGGDGAVSFRREKFVPHGGPDGGDGGRGGDVVVRADTATGSLIAYRWRKVYRAEDGSPGGGRRRHGRSGKGLVLLVPPGTTVSDMAQFGRFVFSYDVINAALRSSTGKDGELWVIDILNKLVDEGKTVIAPPIDGKWLTTGDPLRYLKATFEFAMQRDDLKKDLIPYLKNQLADYA